jgi:RNA polymerase sigma-54 factor
MAVSSTAIQQAVAALSKLTPHPGRQISNAPTQIKHVDLKVEIKKGRIEVECTQEARNKVRRLRVNKYYTDMLNGDVKLDKETREYIQNNKRKAEDFINATNNRFSTMEQVMRAIVKLQPAFFRNGPSFLKPMVLQDIADEVKRDLSTVSRVTNGKYVETPFGIYELKQFFTSGVRQSGKRPSADIPAVAQTGAQDAPANSAPVQTAPANPDGDEDIVGSAQIIEAIKNLVDGEDKKKPLSDQAIADALGKQGIQVARRTVAKYREEKLKILPARQRKRL